MNRLARWADVCVSVNQKVRHKLANIMKLHPRQILLKLRGLRNQVGFDLLPMESASIAQAAYIGGELLFFEADRPYDVEWQRSESRSSLFNHGSFTFCADAEPQPVGDNRPSNKNERLCFSDRGGMVHIDDHSNEGKMISFGKIGESTAQDDLQSSGTFSSLNGFEDQNQAEHSHASHTLPAPASGIENLYIAPHYCFFKPLDVQENVLRDAMAEQIGSEIITTDHCLERKDLDTSDFIGYCREHMNIEPKHLKPIALARIHDLASLFYSLRRKSIVRFGADASSNVTSIFGFHELFVCKVAEFRAELISMVKNDVNHCWHANGRQVLHVPTGPCYEILRQLGVHPVKGTRAASNASREQTSSSRDFMLYSEFRFNLNRMKKNCARLKIGVIGNRRAY